MARPFGPRILALCMAAERIGGWATAREIFEHAGLSGLSETIYTQQVTRCVEHGAMRVDRSQAPFRFIAIPGWRERMEESRRQKINSRTRKQGHKPRVKRDAAPEATPVPEVAIRRVNSIFDPAFVEAA